MRVYRILGKVFIAIILASVLIPPKAALSQTTSDLDILIQEALANNPQLKAAEAHWHAAQSRIPQASSLPDPTAGLSIMGPMLETRLGPQEEMYEFEQMIPFPAKLREKRKIAGAETQGAHAKFKMTERDLIFKVSEVYYDLYAVDSGLKVTGEVRELLNKLEGITQARYASQQGPQRDVAKTQAELSEILQKIFMLRQQKQSLKASLKALLNRRADQPLEIQSIDSPDVPELALTLEDLLEKSKHHRPEVLEAEAMVERQRHALKLSKFEYAPDISVGFQYYKIGAGDTSDPDDGRDAWMIPIKFTIPLWQNRLVPGVKEAKKNLQASEAGLKDTENLSEFEVKNAYYQFMASSQVLDLYENALIPQVEIALKSDQAGYEAGQTDILNFMDSERVYLNSKLAYYQAFAEAMKNFALLERAVGTDLDH